MKYFNIFDKDMFFLTRMFGISWQDALYRAKYMYGYSSAERAETAITRYF